VVLNHRPITQGAPPGFPGQYGRADLAAVACERLPPLAQGQVPDQPQLVAGRGDCQPAVAGHRHAGQPAAVALDMQDRAWSARQRLSLEMTTQAEVDAGQDRFLLVHAHRTHAPVQKRLTSRTARQRPVSMSQTLAVLSSEAVSTLLRSSHTATALTRPLWP